jgi:hypothetical protein
MHNNKNELDVDFIGGQKPLTKEEEKAVSDFIRARKAKRSKSHPKKARNKVKELVKF